MTRKHSFAILAIALAAAVLCSGSSVQAGYIDAVNSLNPIDYWRLEESTSPAIDSGDPPGQNGAVGSLVDLQQAGPRPSQYPGMPANNFAALFATAANNNSNDAGINMGNYAPVTGSGARTVLAWINPSELASNNTIVYYGQEAAGKRFRFQTAGNQLSFDINGRAIFGEPVLQTDQWYLAGVVIPDGAEKVGDVQLWLNGSLQTTTEGTFADPTINTGSTKDFFIGRHPGAAFDFEGLIDEVAVFNYALSEAQMEGLWTAANTAPVPEPGTLLLTALGAALLALRWRRGRTADRVR